MWGRQMIGRSIWSVLVVLLVAVLLTRILPGKRGEPSESAVATMEWTATSKTPRFYSEVTTVSTCHELQRQVAHQPDLGDGRITIACRGPRLFADPL